MSASWVVLPRLKTQWLVCTGLGLLFMAGLWLAYYAGSDVVTRDQWHFLVAIDDYYKHGFSLSDLWASHSEHRTPGYKLFFLLNALWFHLNLMLECYLGVIALLVSAVVLYRGYLASLAADANTVATQGSFLLLAVVFFSFTQWSLYIYSLSALDSFLGNLVFIVCWFQLDRQLRGTALPPQFVYFFAPSFLLALLVFGEGRSPAVIAATLLVMAVAAIQGEPEARRKRWFACAVIAAVSIVSQVIYWLVGPSVAYHQDLGKQVMVLFTAPLGAVKFVLISLASSVATTQLTQRMDDWIVYALGAAVATMYLGALWLCWKKRLWARSYLPLFLMAYSASYLGSLLIGRYGLRGTLDAGAPRYATDLQLGVVGAIWIFYLAYFRETTAQRRRLKPVVIALSIAMLGLQAVDAYAVCRSAPYIRAANIKFRAFLLSEKADKYVTDPPPFFLCPDPDNCVAGTKLLKQYRLIPFQDRDTPPSDQH